MACEAISFRTWASLYRLRPRVRPPFDGFGIFVAEEESSAPEEGSYEAEIGSFDDKEGALGQK